MRPTPPVTQNKWETITELDNSMGSVPTTFSYPHTIGTTFSLDMTESFGDNTIVRKVIISTFFKQFAEKLGTSVTTHYNWKETDTATRSEPTTTEVTETIPAGEKISIQQVVGHCGESTVKTALFRTINN